LVLLSGVCTRRHRNQERRQPMTEWDEGNFDGWLSGLMTGFFIGMTIGATLVWFLR
jgi:predicted lipid-binding transport protein (Tim44 family)